LDKKKNFIITQQGQQRKAIKGVENLVCFGSKTKGIFPCTKGKKAGRPGQNKVQERGGGKKVQEITQREKGAEMTKKTTGTQRPKIKGWSTRVITKVGVQDKGEGEKFTEKGKANGGLGKILRVSLAKLVKGVHWHVGRAK